MSYPEQVAVEKVRISFLLETEALEQIIYAGYVCVCVEAKFIVNKLSNQGLGRVLFVMC